MIWEFFPIHQKEVQLLARLLRSEAEGDGKLGMLVVGNVGVNRIRAACLNFRDITSLTKMVFQKPGGFEATQKGYFYQAARQTDIDLAKKVISGQQFQPATNSLWFFRPSVDCPGTWYNQPNSGRFKAHCFYSLPVQIALMFIKGCVYKECCFRSMTHSRLFIRFRALFC